MGIDENLSRKELTKLEEGEYLLRRDEILHTMGRRSRAGENQFTAISGQNVYYAGGLTGGEEFAPPHSTVERVTTKRIAQRMGVSERTVQQRMQITRNLPIEVRNAIRNTPVANNVSELLRLSKVKEQRDQVAIAGKIVNGAVKTVKDAASVIKRERTCQDLIRKAKQYDVNPETARIVQGDFFTLEQEIKDNSVDAVITDPPYVAKWAENITPFLTSINRILKPSGFAAIYIGHLRLPDVFEGLRACQEAYGEEALQFYWIASLYHTGATKVVHSHGIECKQKPVIIFQKPPHTTPYRSFSDVIEGSGREKDLFEWQQAESELESIFSSFTQENDLVCDPFTGSGTVGVVAQSMKRRFLGYEIEKNKGELASARIKNSTKNENGGVCEG
jgi:16S rRNA G966 N2-methylase RsmD